MILHIHLGGENLFKSKLEGSSNKIYPIIFSIYFLPIKKTDKHHEYSLEDKFKSFSRLNNLA